jgi:hypothetical protein
MTAPETDSNHRGLDKGFTYFANLLLDFSGQRGILITVEAIKPNTIG